MRVAGARRLLAAAGLTALVACSGASQPNEYDQMAAILGDCADTQQRAAAALSGTNDAVAVAELAAAKSACRAAAAELRAHPLPGASSAMAADGAEKMADAVGVCADAITAYRRSPARARRMAQQCMEDYRAGLTVLTAASARP